MGSLFGLEGKSALILGGGLGMGEATALRLAEAGCDIGIVDIVEANARNVAREVERLGRRAVPIVGDVLNDSQLAEIVERADSELDGCDILVTVVGRAGWLPLLEMDLDTWDRELRFNLRYVVGAATSFTKSRIRRGKPGVITCIASVSGVQAAPSHAAYGAAKAGLINLVQSMAVEWAQQSIRVNAIAPGSIITPYKPDTAERRAHTAASHLPMKRRGTTDEIAKAALFLCSDLASYVTGHTLPVDGGWLAGNLMFDPATLGVAMPQAAKA